MKKNIGTTDKLVRIILAIVIAVLFFTTIISGALSIVLLIFAFVLLLTSFISFCPLYWPFGISTIKKNKK